MAEICVTNFGASMAPCIGGSADDYMEGFVVLDDITPVDAVFEILVGYIPGTQVGNCSGQNDFQSLFVTVFAGDSSGLLTCPNAPFIDFNGATICSTTLVSGPYNECGTPTPTLTATPTTTTTLTATPTTTTTLTATPTQTSTTTLTATPTNTRTPDPTPSTTPITCGEGVTTGSYYYTDCCGNFQQGTQVGILVTLDYTKPSPGVTKLFNVASVACPTPTPTQTPTLSPTNTATPTVTPTNTTTPTNTSVQPKGNCGYFVVSQVDLNNATGNSGIAPQLNGVVYVKYKTLNPTTTVTEQITVAGTYFRCGDTTESFPTMYYYKNNVLISSVAGTIPTFSGQVCYRDSDCTIQPPSFVYVYESCQPLGFKGFNFTQVIQDIQSPITTVIGSSFKDQNGTCWKYLGQFSSTYIAPPTVSITTSNVDYFINAPFTTYNGCTSCLNTSNT